MEWFLSRFIATQLAAVGVLLSAAALLAEDNPASETEKRAAQADAEMIDFAAAVQPVLKQHCYECHAGDKQEGGIRWDVRTSVLEGGDSGDPAIVPGKPDESPLIQLVRGDDPDYVMPPHGEGDRLPPDSVAVLVNWVQQGADWPDSLAKAEPGTAGSHWAWVKPQQHPLPEVQDRSWSQNLIDPFILAKLEAEGLKPSPEADRYALIRRVYLDLTGIPPTLEEVEAFVNDTSPDAYENLVDRLLASPRFGERWARMWLDLARYADTQGYEKDLKRSIWRYRDWVIDALNRDLPFDQFTIEQIAGDLLPNPTSEQLIATAFHRNTMTNTEGGTDDEEFRTAAVIDRVATTGQVWLGMSLGCAQCHSHKFDPVTQREFYQIYAFLNQTEDSDQPDERPTYRAPSPELEAELKAARAEVAQQKSVLESSTPELAAAQAAWEARIRQHGMPEPAQLSAWRSVGPFTGTSFDEAYKKEFGPEKQLDLATSYDEGKLTWTEQPEWVDEKVHPLEGGNSAYYLYRTITVDTPRPMQFSLGSDDSIKLWVNGRLLFEKRVFRGAAPDQERVLVQLQAGENQVLMKIVNGNGPAGFYFRATDKTASATVVEILEKPQDQLTDQDHAALAAYFRSVAAELEPEREELRTLEKQLVALEGKATGPPTPVMRELPTDRQRTTHLLVRGSFLNPGSEVEPAVPAAFHPLAEGAPRNRLGLAMWLVDEENPLTARVMVNRFWEKMFGAGLVETSEDFGTQGDPPSHPKLLDRLALDFMEQGWSMKQLCKRIAMSSTYRQSSRVTPEMVAKDPTNRLLMRGPRFRLEAEMVRDQALAVSGLLSSKMHGPSVMPPQPDGVWSVVYNSESWQTSSGEDKYRRGIYTYWRRTSPYPSMMAFDATSREVCTVRRVRTNTPLAALVTLNDPVYVEAAQALARQVLTHGGEDLKAQAAYAVRRCLVRPAKPQEIERIAALVESELAHYREHPEAATQMAGDCTCSDPKQFDLSEAAAWTVVCNVLLNLDETLSKG